MTSPLDTESYMSQVSLLVSSLFWRRTWVGGWRFIQRVQAFKQNSGVNPSIPLSSDVYSSKDKQQYDGEESDESLQNPSARIAQITSMFLRKCHRDIPALTRQHIAFVDLQPSYLLYKIPNSPGEGLRLFYHSLNNSLVWCLPNIEGSIFFILTDQNSP